MAAPLSTWYCVAMTEPHKKLKTSWGPVADWYDEYLENDPDTYHRQVILPNLVRVLDAKPGEQILDIACGQGFLTRELAKTGAKVTASDISKELIAKARERDSATTYHVASADTLSYAKDHSYDAVVIVLAIQNIENMAGVFAEVHRVLKPHGRFILVMNHPAFRVPRRSDWAWDENTKTQYRRIDRYLSAERIDIIAHPSARQSESTPSFHRSLQDIFKALSKQHFAVSRLEEWISHKKSEEGPRAASEDAARKEIPLFLMLETRVL